MSRIRPILLLLLAGTGTLLQPRCFAANDSLVAPQGFSSSIQSNQRTSSDCENAPEPFTGALNFPSKYEGSGSSRDELNVDAERRYKDATSSISSFEMGIASLSSRYIQRGSDADVGCVLSWLDDWAEHGALLGKAETHTGKSVRKWALAAISTSYLRLQQSRSAPLEKHAGERNRIEAWLRAIAVKVAAEWPVDAPINKINNHFYWAAWSLVSTGTVLNDRAMFNQGLEIYRIFERQITADGLLPNEVGRRSRALGYHAYALAPLAMIATFAVANGEAVDTGPKSPLSRLAKTVFDGFQAPAGFVGLVGSKQEVSTNVATNFSWLEPYCSIAACDASMTEFLQRNRPFKSTRLGGDLTTLFGTKQP